MRIEPFALDLDEPLTTAAGEITSREGFRVTIEHRGEPGVGEATPLPGWTESLEACQRALERAAEALDSAADDDSRGRERAWLELDAAETPAARHGFASALLDAEARAEGVPLYEYLDGTRGRISSVPVNATIGDGTVADTVDAATSAVESGFDALKLKVGARSVEEDVERLEAVRDAVGNDVELRADANGAFDIETARDAIEGFASIGGTVDQGPAAGVSILEQPLPAADLAGHQQLRGGDIDISLDESLTEHTLQDVIEAEAADTIICKPMVLGGPGMAHTLAMRARAEGIEPIVTTTIDGVIARTAAVHVAAAIPDVRPCGLATADRLEADLGPDPSGVTDGRITVPDRPGLGVEGIHD